MLRCWTIETDSLWFSLGQSCKGARGNPVSSQPLSGTSHKRFYFFFFQQEGKRQEESDADVEARQRMVSNKKIEQILVATLCDCLKKKTRDS